MTRRAPLLLLAFLAILGACSPGDVSGRTWRVAKDGSGDFTVIQGAVDAAARGDTVLIGAGTYGEYGQFGPPDGSWHWNTCIGVRVDSLTIMGISRDAVTVTPADWFPPLERPDGLMTLATLTHVRVQGITFDSNYDGLYLLCPASIQACTFRQNMTGIQYSATGNAEIAECFFGSNSTDAVHTFKPVGGISIRNCRIGGGGVGFYIRDVQSAEIVNCEIGGCQTGITTWMSRNMSIRDCLIHECGWGMCLWDSTAATLTGNDIAGAEKTLAAEAAFIDATGNIFRGAPAQTLALTSTTGRFSGNHIFKGAGTSVALNYVNSYHLDMRQNYWGTTSPDSIARWIWDGNDDTSTRGYADYLPFSSTPLAAEKGSWGGLKALFR